jgi:hypothetical protein
MEPTMLRDLEAVRQRRAELRESIAALEAALRAPAGEPVVWGEAVQTALTRLAADFDLHVDVTEGPGGLHETIVESSPRLSYAVSVLTTDHELLESQIRALSESVEPPVMAGDVAAVKEQAVALVEDLVKHRQRGADLVYEAFEQDLGAGD